MSTKSTARSAGMSTESTAPLRTIRMSDQDWNELLVTAVNAEYKNRADYIRAVLRSKQPLAEIPHAAPVSVKDLEAEIETYKEKWQASVAAYDKLAVDARSFLSRAETAEAELAELRIQSDNLIEELREIRGDLADWYEFGPPTDHTKKKATALRDEIARLQAELQTAKSTLAIAENPQSTKQPIHRFSLQSIVKRWPEARQARYAKLGSSPDEWIKAALETVYDMLDEY